MSVWMLICCKVVMAAHMGVMYTALYNCPSKPLGFLRLLPWECACTQTTSVSFHAAPPRFTRTPEDQTGVQGGVASFVCQAAGDPQPKIVWNKKGKKVSNQRFEVWRWYAAEVWLAIFCLCNFWTCWNIVNSTGKDFPVSISSPNRDFFKKKKAKF